MQSVYPQNIGQKLFFEPYSQLAELHSLIQIKPKTIIRIYGLSGVGKGTLAKYLGQKLLIPHLDTGFFYRALVWGFLNQNLPNDPIYSKKILQDLQCQIVDLEMQFTYQEKVLTFEDLKSTRINQVIADYTTIPENRRAVEEYIYHVIDEQIHTAMVLDGRGSDEPYTEKLEQAGYKIIRILLDTDLEEKVKRYFLERWPKLTEKDQTDEKTFLDICRAQMIQRDEKDLQTQKNGQWKLISEDSGVIDTTSLNIEQVAQTACRFIYDSLK